MRPGVGQRLGVSSQFVAREEDVGLEIKKSR